MTKLRLRTGMDGGPHKDWQPPGWDPEDWQRVYYDWKQEVDWPHLRRMISKWSPCQVKHWV